MKKAVKDYLNMKEGKMATDELARLSKTVPVPLEGEFKKRIHSEDLASLARANETYGYLMSTKVEGWLDEAKKEFPSFGVGDTSEAAAYNRIVKINKWFGKWFGSSV